MGAAAEADGYGTGQKLLHWLTFLALGAQFVLGYALDRADGLLEWLVDGLLGGQEDVLVLWHAALGIVILLLATIRLAWRRIAGLPPWAPGLSLAERRFAHVVERVLYATLFVIPVTGLALVLLTGEDWDVGHRRWHAPVELVDDDLVLGAHIGSHLVFLGAFAAHLGLVLKHQFVERDGLLRRML